jgi:hypothetical protein
MQAPYASVMGDRDEHAAYEWAEYNLPAELRAQPAGPSPLARRVLARRSLAALRPTLEEPQRPAQPFWLWGSRPV